MTFWFGDLNYRVNRTREEALEVRIGVVWRFPVHTLPTG